MRNRDQLVECQRVTIEFDHGRQCTALTAQLAEVCTAADTSCLMHIGGALRRQRAATRVMHLAEILAAQE